jgi:PTS system cellobiose-specific IIA component
MVQARHLLAQASEELRQAHQIQTTLIQKEASGEKTEATLLMIHAQDHLMNAITVKELAAEFVDLYENILNKGGLGG